MYFVYHINFMYTVFITCKFPRYFVLKIKKNLDVDFFYIKFALIQCGSYFNPFKGKIILLLKC